MSTIVTRAEDAADAVTQLRLRVGGDVATPADANWDEARAAWNLAADQRPAIVVIADRGPLVGRERRDRRVGGRRGRGRRVRA